jgi:hypothetical protein
LSSLASSYCIACPLPLCTRPTVISFDKQSRINSVYCGLFVRDIVVLVPIVKVRVFFIRPLFLQPSSCCSRSSSWSAEVILVKSCSSDTHLPPCTHALIVLASLTCELHAAIVEVVGVGVVAVASHSAGASVSAKPVFATFCHILPHFATFLPHANRVLLAHLARGERAGTVPANGTGKKKGEKREKVENASCASHASDKRASTRGQS